MLGKNVAKLWILLSIERLSHLYYKELDLLSQKEDEKRINECMGAIEALEKLKRNLNMAKKTIEVEQIKED